MDYTVRGILPARILEWVAIPFSRGSQSRDQTQVSTLQADSLPAEPQEKPKNTGVGSLSLLQQIFPTQELRTGVSFTNWAMREALGAGQIWEIPVMHQSIEAANSSK